MSTYTLLMVDTADEEFPYVLSELEGVAPDKIQLSDYAEYLCPSCHKQVLTEKQMMYVLEAHDNLTPHIYMHENCKDDVIEDKKLTQCARHEKHYFLREYSSELDICPTCREHDDGAD